MAKEVLGGISSVSLATTLGLGNIKGSVNGAVLAKSLFNALVQIKRGNLGIHIYLDGETVAKIAQILEAMGVKFALVPVEELEPPYIYVHTIDDKIIVVTTDSDNELVTVAGSEFGDFLIAFIRLFEKKYPKKAEKLEKKLELILSEAGIFEQKDTGSEKSTGEEYSENEVLEVDYSNSMDNTLMGFENS